MTETIEMRKFIFLWVIFILFIGCERSANIVFDNRTSQNLYYTVEGVPYTVGSLQTQKHSFNLGKQYSFYAPEKTIKITAEGETFLVVSDIPSADSVPYAIPGTSTVQYVTLNNAHYKKDRELIFFPNRAGFKLINDSDQVISSVQLRKIDINSNTLYELLRDELQPAEEFWCTLNYNLGTDPVTTYYYRLQMRLKNDENVILLADSLRLQRGEQFLYRLTPPLIPPHGGG